MKRIGFILKVKQDKIEEYKRHHERVWPEMLEALRALVPRAQLAWEAPMACGYGACFGCVVEIDGALLRLCVDGPVLQAAA